MIVLEKDYCPHWGISICADKICTLHTYKGGSPMSKTLYEIRLDLLKLATEILHQPVSEARATLVGEWHIARESNSNIPHPILPDFPTSADIIAEAKKLNEFVSNG